VKYNLNDFQFIDGDNTINTDESKGPYTFLSEDDLSIIESWKGLPPQKVAQEMCELFKESYPDWESDYRWCGEGLLEPGKALDEVAFPTGNTWGELEANLKQVARRFVMNEQLLEYWDTMRVLWRYLPGDSGQRARRQVYRKLDKRKDGKDVRQLVRMEMCSLCWRSVPAREGITARILCHNHSWSSTTPEYRRRFRMKYGETPQGDSRLSALRNRYHEILTPLMKGNTVKYVPNRKSGQEERILIDNAWNMAPFLIVQLLPYVYEYLQSKGADMTSAMSIIKTLEAPFPDQEKEDEIELRTNFYEDCKWYFRFYVEHLIWAEIWLELEANTQRGGKRPGAGRKLNK